MEKFLIGTYYTKNTPYKEVFESILKLSLMEHELDYRVIETESKGSWLKNTSLKPSIIYDLLKNIEPYESLVFLDADASIKKYPNLFYKIPTEFDMACHFLDWTLWYNSNTERKELLTGTMFFRPKPKVFRLIEEWISLTENSTKWEQLILEELVKKSDIKIFNLPIEYCYLKTMPDGSEPRIKTIPVIEHEQISRKLKRIVKNGTV